jgi:hypothetical protein
MGESWDTVHDAGTAGAARRCGTLCHALAIGLLAATAWALGLFGMEPPRRGPVLSIVDEIRLEIEVAATSRT